jgi:hypothetical protein
MVTFAMHLFIDAWPAGWMKTIMDVDRNPKKAFFTYREALKPTIVSLRSDRKHFYAGEDINVEAWVCNDLNSAPQGCFLKYQLEKNGKVISSGNTKASVIVNSSSFQGYINTIAPKVTKRSTYILRASLFNNDGESVDQTVFNIDVFPANNSVTKTKLAFIDSNNGVNAYLANHANTQITEDWKQADVVWVSDYSLYEQHKNELEQMAHSGKRIVLYQVPVGEHDIAGTNVKVQNTSMGSYYFTSPQTGHRFTKNAKPFDFRMWYDEKEEYIMPFLDKIVMAGGWNAILSTGNTNWVEDHGAAMAAGELEIGKGELIICQVSLVNRLLSNPVAGQFLRDLLSE